MGLAVGKAGVGLGLLRGKVGFCRGAEARLRGERLHCGAETLPWARAGTVLGRSLAAGSDPVLGEVGSSLREQSMSVRLSLCWGRLPLIPCI